MSKKEVRLMPCLSFRQPFAAAVLAGAKRWENRTWGTAHRGDILVHASASRASLGAELPYGYAPHGGLIFGAVVGVVEVVDVVPFDESMDLWASGPLCWRLANPRRFVEPYPYRGQPGHLFGVPIDAALARLLRTVVAPGAE